MTREKFRNWIDHRHSLADAYGRPEEELCEDCGTTLDNPAHSPRCKEPCE